MHIKIKKPFKIIIAILITALICVIGFTVNNYRVINSFSRTITDNLKNGICDFNNQNEYIEQVKSSNLPDDIKEELLSESKEENNPLITTVISNSDMKSSVAPLKNTITITISAPDMSALIENYNGDTTPEIAIENVKSYCETASKKDFIFTVHYEKDNGKWIAEYNERDVANAVTGGLADTYDKFWNQWIDGQIALMEDNNED